MSSGDAAPIADLSDRDLLALHVDGDDHAFAELFRRHKDRMWAVALRTVRDPELAADCVQDGFIAAFRRADSFRGEAAVTTWLHRIIVNACLDRHRLRRKAAMKPSWTQSAASSGSRTVRRATAHIRSLCRRKSSAKAWSSPLTCSAQQLPVAQVGDRGGIPRAHGQRTVTSLICARSWFAASAGAALVTRTMILLAGRISPVALMTTVPLALVAEPISCAPSSDLVEAESVA